MPSRHTSFRSAPQPRAKAEAAEPEDGTFSTFMLEDAEDNRILKASLWAAFGFHALLLLINFPTFISEPVEAKPPDETVFVVKPIKFKPPVVKPEIQRQKRVKRIPVPDPNPDDPEPIRLDTPEPRIDLPELDEDFLPIPDAPPAPEPDGPILVTGEVRRPVKVHAPQPAYTEIARRARIQGTVIVQAIIDRNGEVVDTQVLKSLPMGLTEETVKAMRQWKFKPATLHGKPVDVYFNLTVTFALQ
ncbi:MAG: TonB family protein [Acidobacteriota bacterium]